jgi:hypothetical protein
MKPSAHFLPALQHPSLEPGVGRRWGWNVHYAPPTTPDSQPATHSSNDSSGGGSYELQHIHHTSLGMLLVHDVQQDMQPGGPQTQPPHNNVK